MTVSKASAESTPYIRLVTVDRFPDKSMHSEAAVGESFAAQCAVFENHYLQHPHWASAAKDTGRCSIAGLIEQLPFPCGARCFTPVEVTPEFDAPEWCEVVRLEETDGWPPAADIAKSFCDLNQFSLAWTHFNLPAANDVTAFQSIVDGLEELSDTDEAVTIFAATSGAQMQLPEPFTSIIPENSIRLPLWIRIPQRRGCTIQSISGTNDVLTTIAGALGQQSISATACEAEDSADLLQMAERPGVPTERTLVLRSRGVEAVRTNDFLFARMTSQNGAAPHEDSTFGLYAKPEDVWNVHDVSREYHAVVSELSEILDHSNAAGNENV